MISNLLTTAFRNLVRNPLFSLINIMGLSAGLSAFLLLFLYVYNEITFDQFHEKGDRIYRVCENEMEYTKGLVVPYLVRNYPEVEAGTRLFNWSQHRLEYNDFISQENMYYADSSFFDIFSFRFLEGTPESALKEKYGIVLTESMAGRIFGEEPAQGKVIDVDFGEHQLTVTGVIEDPPANSSLQFTSLVNYETGFTLDTWIEQVHDWYNTFSESYVLLREDTDIEALETKFVPFVEENFLTGEEKKPALGLLALEDLHNHVTSNESFTFLLLCIAIGIALIASVNFINLFSALSQNRIRETGIRKTMGGSACHLFALYFGEALVISFLAVVAGILLTLLILPRYNLLFETGLEFDPVHNPWLLGVLVAFWLVAGLLGGFLPAIRQSKLPIVSSLKGRSSGRPSRQRSRYGFASMQFIITIILIIGTLTIRKQIAFMQNHSLNFDAEHVIVIRTQKGDYRDGEAANQKFRAIINELKADSRVAAVTTSAQVPGTYIENYNMFYTDGWADKEAIRLRQVDIGTDYFKTWGIPFLEGNYSKEAHIQDSNAVVVNKKALEELGAGRGMDQMLYASSRDGRPLRIIGVVEDFFYQGLHREIQPLIHFYNHHVIESPDLISVRVQPGQLTAVLDELRSTWRSTPPAGELDYFFADEEIERQYAFVEKTGMLATFFSVLAIILSCLGLLAMIMYVVNRRVKEIGIRKVVGATVSDILQLFAIQYMKWIVVSFIIAVPVAWYAMHQWLMQNFAHKTPLSWWLFALSGLLALSIALVTVIAYAGKAARRNPVEVLRYE